MLMCRVRVQGLGFRTWGLGFQSLSQDGAYSFFTSARKPRSADLRFVKDVIRFAWMVSSDFLDIGELGTIAKFIIFAVP